MNEIEYHLGELKIGGITRAMRRAGFEQVRVEHGRFFVVTAVMKQRSPFTDTKEEKLCAASAE